MSQFLAIIPARQKSKGLKNKNILKLNGKPLIHWTIKAALESKKIDKIIVTTDSNYIIKYSNSLKKGIAPFKRPPTISNAKSKMHDVVKHSVNFLKLEKKKFKYFIILQPTSPLRNSKDIDKACNFFVKKKLDSLASVKKIEHSEHPENLYFLKKKKILPKKKIILKNRQTFPDLYSRNGAAIYIGKIKNINKYILGGKTEGFLMQKNKSIDINDYDDFVFAEYLMKKKK